MSEMETGNLIYLVVLLAAVVFWFVTSNRARMGQVMQQALLWGLIFIGVIAAYGMWDDIRGTVIPRQAVFADAGQIELPLQPDGHYYMMADVNGVATRFVVDTGASAVVLTQEAANAAGITPDELAFTSIANTANGPVRTASVVLDTLAVGGIEKRGFRVLVNEGEMPESLLGMTYLSTFSRIEIAGGKLVLEK
ncbi:retropepsin-like aspartic protease family protein [Primorskyibacter sp. S187A]|uniref:retropepsin-like aspartic protease family protein n=1 Tax=Primorskyibacter sp. S187A TaxID=3415130 RepID=UPI003C7B2D31